MFAGYITSLEIHRALMKVLNAFMGSKKTKLAVTSFECYSKFLDYNFYQKCISVTNFIKNSGMVVVLLENNTCNRFVLFLDILLRYMNRLSSFSEM